MEPQVISIADVLQIISRRKWSLILPAFFIMAVSSAVALLLPSVYRSTATILIEDQEVPSEYVMSTMTSFAEQRIQSINQRIMSSARLQSIIDEFDLYPDLRKKWTESEVVDKMEKDISLTPISAEVVDRRTGRPGTATIAFAISYQGKDPGKVQKVADTLTSLFLKEDLQVRSRQAKDTTDFLNEEMNRIKTDLDQIDHEFAEFKEKHINELPEMFQLNIQMINNAERDLAAVSQQVQGMKDRIVQLQVQLSNTSKFMDANDQLRLDELKIKLAYLKSQFSDQYPDVISLKAEINEIENMVALQNKNQADHPDNPAYIALAAQLSAAQSEMRAALNQMEKLKQQRDQYRQYITATPKVEQNYNNLLSQRQSTQAKYDDLLGKYMEAKVAHGLEKEQKGERFTLIDPAKLPEKPFKPNRLAIILIGVVLGVGAGVGLAALREFSDHSIHSADALSMATGFPVLAGIPEIVTIRDIRRRLIRRVSVAVGTVGAIVAGVIIFHTMVMDLNVFWAKVMRKLAHYM